MPKTIIFDIDGTLVQSVDLHAVAWVEAFRKFGKEIDFQTVREQIGKGGDQLLPVFFSPTELAGFGDEMKKYRQELFLEKYMPQVTPFGGVRELFERLIADGKTIVLASSANRRELKHLKQIARIEDLLDDETSSDDAEKSKPHPDIFQAAMEKAGVRDPATAIVVGDTPYDAIAACKAGLKTVGVRCGGWSDRDLENAGCVALYDHPADLLANYDSSPLAG